MKHGWLVLAVGCGCIGGFVNLLPGMNFQGVVLAAGLYSVFFPFYARLDRKDDDG